MNVFIVIATCFVCGVLGGGGPSPGNRDIIDHNTPNPVHPRENFYPFGHAHGDVQLHDSDDSSSNEIHLQERLVFFDGSYHSAWVNHNGVITTGGPFYTYTSAPFPLGTGNPSIAPYWTDVDISNSNNVPGHAIYYRQDTSPQILNRATTEVLGQFSDEVPQFQATWVLIATYYKVTYYGNNGYTSPTPIATFQVILVSDGIHSFALFHYDQIDWVAGSASGASRNTGMGGTGAQVGFDAGDGVHFHNIQGSQTNRIRNVIQFASLRFRIDRNEIEDSGNSNDLSCTVGSFGPRGEEPCTLCPHGSYQGNEGASNCRQCDEGETTAEAGSTHVEECYTPASGQFDPHFMITDPITKEHLCFDYTGSDDEVLELIDDKFSGINVAGKLFAVSEDNPDVTFFGDIEIKTENSVVIFNRDDINVNGDSYSWSDYESVVSGDVEVHPVEEKTQTFKITIDDGRVSVVVNRNEGPVAGKYLGIYVVRVDGLSEHTTGIIGQFVNSKFVISKRSPDQLATISLMTHTVEVPVEMEQRFSPTSHGKIDCWVYTPEGDNQLFVPHQQEEEMFGGAV